jgi:hypothetical protein
MNAGAVVKVEMIDRKAPVADAAGNDNGNARRQ